MFTYDYSGRYMPPEVLHGRCYVWNNDGALTALSQKVFQKWFDDGNDNYVIAFGNGGFAHVKPGDVLWNTLSGLATEYLVEIFPLTLSGPWTVWNGAAEAVMFDAIRIKRK